MLLFYFLILKSVHGWAVSLMFPRKTAHMPPTFFLKSLKDSEGECLPLAWVAICIFLQSESLWRVKGGTINNNTQKTEMNQDCLSQWEYMVTLPLQSFFSYACYRTNSKVASLWNSNLCNLLFTSYIFVSFYRHDIQQRNENTNRVH